MTDLMGPVFEVLGFLLQAALECAAYAIPAHSSPPSEALPPPAAADRSHRLWDRDLDF